MNIRIRSGGRAAVLLLVLGQSSCGTGINLWLGTETDVPTAYGKKWDTQIYGGIQNDFHIFGEAVDGYEGFLWSLFAFVLAFIDLPLSLVGDTLTLPYTIPYVLSRPDPKE